ncbi:DUF6111 family protein [Maricaulis sp.]|jgi:Family of unknown function (DUF6111)|uniref:DUF6111 family protein n=1 Tax=Maricaulis sp. TaxID=1486257 RepID=UPI0025DC6264|nr:DUF6111 family protein [Maricaulis sp.]MDF1769205.1 DUF6111 family protein [Maricaulis sp.]
MIRITLIEIASFLLPFALFMIWQRLSTRRPEAGRLPTLRLAAAGAGLAVVTMLVLVILDASRAGHEGERYVPPQNIDGRIVPGHFVPAEDDEDSAEPTGEDDAPQ